MQLGVGRHGRLTIWTSGSRGCVRQRRPFGTGLVAVLLMGMTAGSPSASTKAPAVTVTSDVVYGHKYGMALTFDVLAPDEPNGAGVVRVVSGGWRSRWRPPQESIGLYQPLLDQGFTVFVLRHGSSPKFVVPEVVADTRRALRFIRVNARTPDPMASILTGWACGEGAPVATSR